MERALERAAQHKAPSASVQLAWEASLACSNASAREANEHADWERTSKEMDSSQHLNKG